MPDDAEYACSDRHTRRQTLEKTLRIISFVVLALMFVAAVYAGAIGIHYWTGIGV
jgi:hypothetical protein